MNKVVVISGTARMTVPEQIDKCKHIYELMVNNTWFPNPPADYKVFLQEIEEVEKASSAAKSGGTKSTADLHYKVNKLAITLDILRAYVQLVANHNIEEASVIVSGAGMSLKGYTPRIRSAFSVKPGSVSGEIIVSAVYANNTIYIFQLTTTPTDESSWKEIWHSTKSRKRQNGLESGRRYYFRMCNVHKDMQGPWSEVASCIAT